MPKTNEPSCLYYLIHIFGSTDPEIVSEGLSSYEELLAAAKAWDYAEQDGIFYLVIKEGEKPKVCAFINSEIEEEEEETGTPNG